jgi:crotonobetainyl-CoA:carnitine CoA-transferase CaiB-like acyl-CoA transferase
MKEALFKDLVVIEFASVLAGPLVGSFFAELGAKVIKVENKLTGGDVTRKWKLKGERSENSISAYYASANFGKESLFLNLKDPNDFEKANSLIKKADIVLINFQVETALSLKLDYKSVGLINPKIIYAALTGFGDNDNRAAYDVVLQAETGFMSMNGETNGRPVKIPVALIDVLAAHHLKEAILCALIHRMKTDSGTEIKISLYDCAIASLINQATNWLMQKHIPKRIGTQHPNISPYGDMFLTLDEKYLVLAIGSDKQFERFAKLLDIEDSKYTTNEKRLVNREALNQLIGRKIDQKNSEYWADHLTKNDIPFGLVKNMQEVFDDERAKRLLIFEENEGIYTVRPKTALI